ncbi:hypothetical protein BGX34_004942 [Mortierella sp. NVP85]|nr:hypothetical protein BGX34_004942 [Mortierella sp. NVP85]
MYTYSQEQAALYPFTTATTSSMQAMISTQPLLHYPMVAPAAEDCLASNEYIYQQQQQQPLATVKSEFSNDQFAALSPAYMMMSMGRSHSDSQIDLYSAALSSGTNSTALYTYGNDNVYASQQPRHYNTRTQSEPAAMAPLFENDSSSIPSTSAPMANLIKTENESETSSSSSSSLSPTSSASVLVRPTPKRSRGRRVSSLPDATLGCKVFTCPFADCGKIFKRSEHLKRHVRSIHTMEKPFPCPIHNCPKRFSRSDNLNQHIRIHRHNNGFRGSNSSRGSGTTTAGGCGSAVDKNSNTMASHCMDDTSKAIATFTTPFFSSFAAADLISL